MTRPTPAELLETWNRWSYRDLLVRATAQAEASGQMARAAQLRSALAGEPPVDPLDALAANHELTSLLRGWQWHAIRAARESGATWDQIAAVLDTMATQARAGYLDHIERAERHGRGLTDTAPYRAVLDDPPGSTAQVASGHVERHAAQPAEASAQPAARATSRR